MENNDMIERNEMIVEDKEYIKKKDSGDLIEAYHKEREEKMHEILLSINLLEYAVDKALEEMPQREKDIMDFAQKIKKYNNPNEELKVKACVRKTIFYTYLRPFTGTLIKEYKFITEIIDRNAFKESEELFKIKQIKLENMIKKIYDLIIESKKAIYDFNIS